MTCNPHPKAPHGFDRTSSHTLDRYVCDCEGWDPWQAGYDEGFAAGLRYAEVEAEAIEEEITMVEFEGKQYNNRHGGPFDRGSADSWYGRGPSPHYFVGATYDSVKLEEVDMSENEVADYMAGYKYNELFGDKKEY